MLIAILILLVAVAFGYSVESRRGDQLIGEHRYNNRYNDASGAREDSF